MTPVAIGDIQRTQGTRKTCIMPKNRYRHLLLCLIHGTRYSLCHRDITEHERNPNGSVIAQKAKTDTVGNSGEEPLDMTNKEQNTIMTILTSQELPVHMTVSRETVPVNTTDDSDPKNLGQCDDIVSENNQLEHDGNSNVSPVDIEGNEESVQNIPEENSTSENMTPQTPTSKKVN